MLVKSSITPMWCSQIKWGRWLSPKRTPFYLPLLFFIYPEIFHFFGFSSLFLGPTVFTDFTGDLRWVSLVAKDFCPTLDTLNLQLVTFEMIDSEIFQRLRIQTFWVGCRDHGRHFLWIPLFLFCFKDNCSLLLVLAFLPDIRSPPLGHHHYMSHNI